MKIAAGAGRLTLTVCFMHAEEHSSQHTFGRFVLSLPEPLLKGGRTIWRNLPAKKAEGAYIDRVSDITGEVAIQVTSVTHEVLSNILADIAKEVLIVPAIELHILLLRSVLGL